MKTMNNPCEECVQTTKHCCKTDLHLNFADTILMLSYAEKLGKNVVVGQHPEGDRDTMLIIPNKPGIDIRDEPCVFFGSDGKCEIYEDRPSICRTFGTEHMRCRYEYSNIRTKEEIECMTKEKMRELDDKAMDKDFKIIADHFVNFNFD